MDQRRPVVLVAYEGFQLLDLAGPSDVFSTATALLGSSDGYRLVVATPDGGAVIAANGLGVTAEVSIADAAVSVVDTAMVVGGPGSRSVVDDGAVLADVRALASVAGRTTSVCTGALVLAAAGLLDGYRATTHWASCGRLARDHPEVEVEPDRLHVHDRDRWTSAGVTAGIDLALALVEADHGSALAHDVARWLVVFARRPGGQAQFSAQMRAQPARDPRLRDLQGWLPDHLTDDLTVGRLAARAGMSPRTFARAFRSQVGSTPAAHVEELRVEAARRLLETTDLTVAAVARRAGFGRVETLHRAFSRRVGTTPDRYRQHHTHI